MSEIPERDLVVLREQLKTAIEFMEATPCVEKHHNRLWWLGNMPACPDRWDPISWERTQFPIWSIWDDYLSALKDAGLDEYYKAAHEVEIADLLEYNWRE